MQFPFCPSSISNIFSIFELKLSLAFSFIGVPEYPIAGFNRLCSDTGYERIVGLDRCKEAAKSLGRKFSVSKAWKQYPNGCYIYSNNHVFFNYHATGTRSQYACPVCFRQGMHEYFTKIPKYMFVIIC